MHKKINKKINIAQMMIPKVMTAVIEETNSVRQGMEIFKRHGYTAIPVIGKDGKYKGCVTEGDLLRFVISVGSVDMYKLESYRIKDVYRPEFCEPLLIQAQVEELIDVALKQNFIPVIDDRGCLCGIVTRRAVINNLAKLLSEDSNDEINY